MSDNLPRPEYGEWFENDIGQIVRTVTRWIPSLLGPFPMVDIELKPTGNQPQKAVE